MSLIESIRELRTELRTERAVHVARISAIDRELQEATAELVTLQAETTADQSARPPAPTESTAPMTDEATPPLPVKPWGQELREMQAGARERLDARVCELLAHSKHALRPLQIAHALGEERSRI